MVDAVPSSDAERLTELRAELATIKAKARDDIAETLAISQHRVRNALAAVRAILSRPAQLDMTVEDYSAHLIGRVDTMVRLQGVLTRSPTGRIDLEEIVRDEFVVQGGLLGHHVVIGGPSVALPGKVAEVLGVAVHELASNSIKFGALAAAEGHVDIAWSLGDGADATMLTIKWTESGGPVGLGAVRRGFGREWIEVGLPYQLGAMTVFDLNPEGFTCTIVLSIEPPPSSRLALPGLALPGLAVSGLARP